MLKFTFDMSHCAVTREEVVQAEKLMSSRSMSAEAVLMIVKSLPHTCTHTHTHYACVSLEPATQILPVQAINLWESHEVHAASGWMDGWMDGWMVCVYVSVLWVLCSSWSL